MSTVFGGIIIGVGVGLIIRFGGALDGTEMLAIIGDRRLPFSVGEIIMFFNFFILGVSGFVFSWNSAMYSLIAYFIAYKAIDVVSNGLDEMKGVLIVTKRMRKYRESLRVNCIAVLHCYTVKGHMRDIRCGFFTVSYPDWKLCNCVPR